MPGCNYASFINYIIMSTMLTGVLIIAGTIAICLFFMFINHKNTRQRNKALAAAINQAAATKGLTLTSQEFLKNKIIGLDGLHKRLVVFYPEDHGVITDINLADIKSCKLKKEFEQVDFGNGKNTDIELQLRSIDIRFSFKNKADTFSLTFYDSKLHSIYEMSDLEIKARDWELLLSKLIWADAANEVLQHT